MNNKNSIRANIPTKKLIRAVALAPLALMLASCANTETNPACLADTTPIATIQGSSDSSALVGQMLTTRGIITADWTATEQLGGFFIQSISADQDQDPATAEGLFIATEELPATAAAGSFVYVTGVVAEAQQLTQLQQVSNVSICSTPQTLPEPIALQLPQAEANSFEQYEGMLVAFAQDLVVNGHYQLARHGQFEVAHERLYTPTQVVAPGADAQQLAQQNQLAKLLIDDNRAPNPAQVPYPAPELSADNTLRSGDTLQGAVGIMSQYQRQYRLQPTTQLTFEASNPRPAALPQPAQNTIRVAAFNVLNYFNGEGDAKTFPTQRGAKTAAQFKRQHDKIVAALAAMNADIIGLMEIENDGYAEHSAIVELTQALAVKTGQPWRFIQAGDERFGSDTITNGLLYRSDKVEPQGAVVSINQAPFDSRSRLPLIQRFAPLNTVENLVVAVNHFKSKGSCPKDSSHPDANQDDGQACWNATRTQSAELLADTLDQHPELSRHSLRVLLGDFNAYAKEDPITTLLSKGYYNRLDSFDAAAYSYVYDAQAGSLDHLLVSAALNPRVVKQGIWSINADEPTALQYSYADTQAHWYAPSAYRASDHDPVYADIQF